MVFCVMILCTFAGVLCGTRGDGVRRWWSGRQGIALTDSQMRFERRSEGTRGNNKAGQKKRSEAKYGCGGDGEPVSSFWMVVMVWQEQEQNTS